MDVVVLSILTFCPSVLLYPSPLFNNSNSVIDSDVLKNNESELVIASFGYGYTIVGDSLSAEGGLSHFTR